jgi:hypothetical protein
LQIIALSNLINILIQGGGRFRYSYVNNSVEKKDATEKAVDNKDATEKAVEKSDAMEKAVEKKDALEKFGWGMFLV